MRCPCQMGVKEDKKPASHWATCSRPSEPETPPSFMAQSGSRQRSSASCWATGEESRAVEPFTAQRKPTASFLLLLGCDGNTGKDSATIACITTPDFGVVMRMNPKPLCLLVAFYHPSNILCPWLCFLDQRLFPGRESHWLEESV